MATQTLNLSLVGTKPGKKSATKKIGGQSPKTTKSASAASATMTHEQFEKLTVVQQIKHAFKPGARIAAWIGLVVGGFVPVATYVLAHYEVTVNVWLWALVAGGLIYSATTVFGWADAAFGSKVKATGFVVLLEGVLTFVPNIYLSLAALVILIFVNAVSAACQLQVRKQRDVDIDG